jgi:hypothetical protein
LDIIFEINYRFIEVCEPMPQALYEKTSCHGVQREIKPKFGDDTQMIQKLSIIEEYPVKAVGLSFCLHYNLPPIITYVVLFVL